MSLGGTKREHIFDASWFFNAAHEDAEDALRLSEEGKVRRAFDKYQKALTYWGSYLAEAKWAGRFKKDLEHARVAKLFERAERSLRAHFGI